nr:probable folate-biopterin transporter 2 [Ipomoea batatas]
MLFLIVAQEAAYWACTASPLKQLEIAAGSIADVSQNFIDAVKDTWRTLKYPVVWQPCLYMYLSFALSFDISEGQLYWKTDAEGGPRFSKESIGYISAIGSVGSLLGAILYQYGLKDHPFRELLFWTQLLFGLSGMLDLVFVLRLNLRFGIPDYFSCSALPASGAHFFALLMSIDNTGLLTSSWGGGFLLHVLNVTRTQFGKLWLAVLIRNILRVTPLCMLFLVPRSDPNSSLLPSEVLGSGDGAHEAPALSRTKRRACFLVESMDTAR